MPMVRKERIFYEQGEYYQVTKFTSKTGKFSIELPKWTHEVLGYSIIYGESISEIDSKYYAVIRDFDEMARYKKRVIVYDFEVNAIVWDEDEERVIFREEEMTFVDGTGLAFKYGVLDERLAPGEKVKKYYLKDGRYAFQDHMNSRKVMEWTPEREAFCKTLKRNIENLAMNAWNFFHQEPEQVALMMDQGMRLLPGPVERERPIQENMEEESLQIKRNVK